MNNFDKLKNYFKDNTIKGYNVSFKLINKDEYSISLNTEEFNELKYWHESNEETNYRIKIDNKSYNLNKEYIVEFEYEDFTNLKDMLYRFKYFFTKPVPKFMNIFSFLILSITIGFIGLIETVFNAYTQNINIKDFMRNSEIYSNSILNGLSISIALFLIFLSIFLIISSISIIYNRTYYFSEARKHKKEKFYNYNIINFIFLICISLLI